MKLTLILVFIPTILFSQFLDEFESLENWRGEINKFRIQNGELQLYDTLKEGAAWLERSSQIIEEAVWRWDFRMDFNPSSSNYMKVVLAEDLEGSCYYVRIGSVLDDICLFYKSGDTVEKLIDGLDDRLDFSSVAGTVEVRRDSTGRWFLFSRVNTDQDLILEGISDHTPAFSPELMGLELRYTSTRSDKLFIDNFLADGNPLTDKIPPKISEFFIEDINRLKIHFSEGVLGATETKNYTIVPGSLNPATIVETEGAYELIYLKDFEEGEWHELRISGIRDLEGNLLDTVLGFRPFVSRPVQFRDIIINEIMSDPIPTNGLPETEYIELYNTTEFPVNLSGYTWEDRTRASALKNVWIPANSYIVLVPDTTGFPIAGRTFAVNPWPSLNNNSDVLKLRGQTGEITDSIQYSSSWHVTGKADGGWSLERISNKILCGEEQAWTSSISNSGGSPGFENSVIGALLDSEPPSVISSWYEEDSLQLLVLFDEAIYSETNPMGESGGIYTGYSIDNSKLRIDISEVPASNKLFDVSLYGISDCFGNSPGQLNLQWAVTEPGIPGSLIINEIMFDPDAHGEEFIELYNLSEKIVDLSEWKIKVGKDSSNSQALSNLPSLFLPGEYIVIAVDRANLLARHPHIPNAKSYEVDFGGLSNTSESIFLSVDNKLSDSLTYNRDWHFELLVKTRGISLERINPFGTSGRNNWTSASSLSGFATPGKQNSHSGTGNVQQILISPEVIIPDNNGFRDIAEISPGLEPGAWSLSCRIFTLDGTEVRDIANNVLMDGQESLFWDGIMNNSQKAPMGLYIVQVTAVSNFGDVVEKRGVIAVSRIN